MMISKRLFSVCIFLALANFSTAFAQINPHKQLTQYELKNWQSEDGLPQNSITSIVQSAKGYLWIGTYDGLARFDGVNFTTINRKNNPELASSYILSLAEDSTGALWIGTSGSGLWYLNQNELQPAPFKDVVGKLDITSIIISKRGELWIGTYGKGLFRWNGEILKHWGVEDGLPGNIIQVLFEAKDGTIWGGNRGSGIFQLESDTKINKIGSKDGISNTYIRDFAQDKEGFMWVATSGGGVFKQTQTGWKNLNEKSGLNSVIVNSIQIDELGTVWMGTETGGLNRYVDGEISALTSADGLGSDAIPTLFLDREHNLWMGTSGAGITRLSDGKFTSVTTKEGLISNFIWTVAEDAKGRIWLGTNGEGISILDDSKTTSIQAKQGLKDGHVRSILKASDGTMWVGTYKGLHQLKDEKVVAHFDKSNGLNSSIILSLYEDKDGVIWAGLSGSGLVGIKNGKIIEHFDTEDVLTNSYVRSILVDQNGKLWIGTGGGGITILQNQKKVGSYSTENGLKSNTIIALYEDNRQRMWIGTHGGGLSMVENGKVYSATVLNGLSDDIIFHILEDKQANLWMSSNRGVIRIPKRDLLDLFYGKRKTIAPVLFGKPDGMKSAECNGANQPAALLDSKGRMWFPTAKGVSFIDANNIIENPLPAHVLIESVTVDYEKTYSELPSLFETQHHAYQFNYTSPTFTSIEKLEFKVKLEGFDPDWITKGNQRSTIYTNLLFGDYTFKVSVKNGDNFPIENNASYSFTIPTPFYFTWWAICIYIISFIYLVYFLLNLHKQKTNKKREEEIAFAQLKFDAETERLKRESSESIAREREREYDLEIQKRSAELERNEHEKEKLTAKSFAEGIEKERARIARELQDQILGSLNTIMRKVQIETKKTSSYDELKLKMEALLQQLDLVSNDIRTIMDDLKPEKLEFFSLADTLDSLLQKNTDREVRYIKTSVTFPKILPNLSPYQNVTIYRIFQEGIHNAIKHAEPNEISIQIENVNEHEIRFTLKNNGIPFDVEKTFARMNQKSEKTGSGLLNIQHRAQTINATIKWTSDSDWTKMILSLNLNQ